MTHLLDTNIISETIKPRPTEALVTWLDDQVTKNLFLTSITVGELVRRVRRVREAARPRKYERWIEEELVSQFEGRILPFDTAVASIRRELLGGGDREGRPRPAADVQIAAIARHHDLTLATRNTRDFASLGVRLFNPWKA